MSIWTHEHENDAIEPLDGRLELTVEDALAAFVTLHDKQHVMNFCNDALSSYPPLIGTNRIENLMNLLPEPADDETVRTRAARTGFAVLVFKGLTRYGVDINTRLDDEVAEQGRAILRFCMAFPEQWRAAESSEQDSRDELLGFVAAHASQVETIISVCEDNSSRLDTEFLSGYLDSTAPPLRVGFL